MFCLGSHCGSENDGYKTGTGGNRFHAAYRKRKQDFRRRIIERIYEGNRQTVLAAEQRWLNLIKSEELHKRYYNRKNVATGQSREDMLRIHAADPTIRQRTGMGVRRTYAANPELGKRQGAATKARYAADPELGKRQAATYKATLEADPAVLIRIGEGVRAANAADPSINIRRGASIRATNAADPGINIRRGASIKATLTANPEIGIRRGQTLKDFYANNPDARDRVSEGVADSYVKNPDLRRQRAEVAKAFRTGTRWINNGTTRRQLRPEEPLPEGWRYGYKLEDPTP
jgi:hypothetical protein